MTTISSAWSQFPSRVAISAGLVTTGVVHTQLYGRGYRSIEYVGPSFAVQAAAAFALAALVLVGPWTMRAAAAVLSAAALGGFVLSRTIGLFGFTEIGWQPAPQAMIAVVAEICTLVVCLASLYRRQLRT
ncbi:hypothetical protein ACFYU5_06445 [Nocardia aobensis]|uniref:DUF4345 domain-containing protein n=1 Tax=Nocardia aobensis TaxID=257277 RepID=A0ABW6NYW6_9NOCA